MKKKQESKKRLIIVHGWEGRPEEGWFPWLTAEMERRGWSVQVPAMPNAVQPEQSRWVPYLSKIIGRVDGNTYIVGHSLGCIATLRFLEGLANNEKIGGAILVAGFDNPLKYKELKNFFRDPILWDKIKTKCKSFISIQSNDDPYVPVENGIRFKTNLGAKVITLSGLRHFSGRNGVTIVPPILEELLKTAK